MRLPSAAVNMKSIPAWMDRLWSIHCDWPVVFPAQIEPVGGENDKDDKTNDEQGGPGTKGSGAT